MGYDVIVIGAGIIGLSSALRCSQLGLRTLLVDRDLQPSGASRAAGGMLAPVTEAWFGQHKMVRLNLEGARRFPGFIEELEELTGMRSGMNRAGTLYVALDRDQSEALDRLTELHQELGLASVLLTVQEARDLEPALHPSVRRAVLAEQDGSVDPRLLLDCLMTAVRKMGVEVRMGTEVTAIGQGPAVELDGSWTFAAKVVIAAGSWAPLIPGCPDSIASRVRPVKGQILRMSRANEPMPVTRTIRTEDVYLVPRPDGELAVGATSEEKGYDLQPNAGAVYELLRAAIDVVPAVREMTWREVSTGLRPATPDGLPLIGPTEQEGVIAACGHYRNGILLCALTADAVAQVAAKDSLADEVSAADPRRVA